MDVVVVFWAFCKLGGVLCLPESLGAKACGVGGLLAEVAGGSAVPVPAVCQLVGGAGVPCNAFANLLANALVSGVGGGGPGAAAFNGIEGCVNPVDEQGQHGEDVPVPDGV